MSALLAAAQGAGVAVALYAASTAFAARLTLAPWLALAAGAGALAVASMTQFWAMAVTPQAGAYVRLILVIAVTALTAEAITRRAPSDRELLTPCALALFGLAVLLAALYVDRGAGSAGWPDALRMAALRWTHELPADNQLPFLFGEYIRLGQMASPFYGDWLSSDRPPLQTGLYLLFSFGDRHLLTYQAIAIAAQMLALPAIWGLARALGASSRHATLAALGALATPLVIVNGGFVWPKLIAAAYLALAVAAHFADERPQGRDLLLGAIAGACGGAAMLGHGATAFAALGCGLAALATRRVHGVRYLAAAAVAAVLLYGPWMAYQRAYDPPGDRLMKWHLAGVIPVDARPLGQTLMESYGALTPQTWWAGRVVNAQVLLKSPGDAWRDFAAFKGSLHDRIQNLRNAAFYQVPLSLGVFALLLYALPALLLWRPTRPVALATFASLVVWVLLIFEPGQTIPHQGSMFPQLALAALGARAASAHAWGRHVWAALITVQCAVGVFLYGVS